MRAWSRRFSFVLAVLSACVTSACYRGYKSAKELDSDERGPTACAKSCKDLGMQMSAFVLVEHGMSGCVCSPPGAPSAGGPASAAAAAHIVQEEQREQQAQQQMQVRPAPMAAP